MDHQTGAKLRFEPRRLRRHNITRIGDIHSFAILRVLKSIHTAPVATVSTRQCCKDILSLTSRFVWVNLIVRSL